MSIGKENEEVDEISLVYLTKFPVQSAMYNYINSFKCTLIMSGSNHFSWILDSYTITWH